ncbi:MAG: glycosyltransferase, partial [Solirubrobacteraceae bacterium]
GAARGTGAAGDAQPPRISVVVPARDEERRLGGVLAPLRGAPGVVEVIVVDDRSTDRTAEVAAAWGARVVEGEELPEGWIGKPWALQQGLTAATGDLVVFLDADVRPDPKLPAAIAALLEDDADLASAQLAFHTPGLGQRVLHPALLATLVYRTGPLDTRARQRGATAAINGQCFAVRREELVRAGGFALVAGISTDDVALARALARTGWKVAVADGSRLGTVRMYESAGEVIREWAGRSLALPGASSRTRMYVDLAVVWSAQGGPGLRLWRALWRAARGGTRTEVLGVLRRADLVALAIRGALQLALLRSYRLGGRGARGGPRAEADGAPPARGLLGRFVPRRGIPDPVTLLAPLADPIAVAALARGTVAPVRRWRGREL